MHVTDVIIIQFNYLLFIDIRNDIFYFFDFIKERRMRCVSTIIMTLFKNKYRIESARLKDWDYSTPWWYYVTVCTKNMKLWFGEIKNENMILNSIGKVIDEEWNLTGKLREKVELDYYQIMPNHFHGIIIIEGEEIKNVITSNITSETHSDASLQKTMNNLSYIISGFKAACTGRIHRIGYKKFSWQSRFYDHIIRNEKDLFRIRNYIHNNPLKWELDEYYCKD